MGGTVGEHLRHARLPWLDRGRLAIARAEGGGVVDVRREVHRNGHNSMPRSMAVSTTRQACRERSSPTNVDGAQSARHRPHQEPCPPRSEQAHRHQVSLSLWLCWWRTNHPQVRPDRPIAHGYPHQTTWVPFVLGVEEQDSNGGSQAQGVAAGLEEEL